MKKVNEKNRIIATCFILLSVLLIGGPLALRVLEPPCGLTRLRQLKIGMQRSKVLDILGTPDKEDELTCIYESKVGWTWVGFDTKNELVFVDAEGAMGGWSLRDNE